MTSAHDNGPRTLKEVYDWMLRHDAQVQAWWHAQWKDNRMCDDHRKDHEDRIRVLEKVGYRFLGVVAALAFVGSLVGGAAAAAFLK